MTKKAGLVSDALRIGGLAYGILGFALTFVFFARYVMFLGNMPTLSKPWLGTTVDTGGEMAPLAASLIDLALVALFGLQHSLMARPAFKAWWTRIVPAGLERSTYVVAASLVGFIMMLFWQPIPIVIWDAKGGLQPLAWALFACGWLLLLGSAISFDLFELLGLRQAWAWYHSRPIPKLTLKTHWLYGWVAHPMYVGFLLGVWMTPFMTAGHALMATAFTLYVFVAMRYEQRDLSRTFGAAYQLWRQGTQEAPPHP